MTFMAAIVFSEYLILINLGSHFCVFLTNLHVTGLFLMDLFKDPILSSVIPMVTPTRCHRATGGNPVVGDC